MNIFQGIVDLRGFRHLLGRKCGFKVLNDFRRVCQRIFGIIYLVKNIRVGIHRDSEEKYCRIQFPFGQFDEFLRGLVCADGGF